MDPCVELCVWHLLSLWISGRQYETLIKESIFDLLGMEDSTFLDKVDEISNIARPHVGIDGCSTPIDLEVHR